MPSFLTPYFIYLPSHFRTANHTIFYFFHQNFILWHSEFWQSSVRLDFVPSYTSSQDNTHSTASDLCVKQQFMQHPCWSSLLKALEIKALDFTKSVAWMTRHVIYFKPEGKVPTLCVPVTGIWRYSFNQNLKPTSQSQGLHTSFTIQCCVLQKRMTPFFLYKNLLQMM